MSAIFKKIKQDEDLIFRITVCDTNVAPTEKVNKSSAINAPEGEKSGLVPVGDVRLTANIRRDLHEKLKIRATKERTTIGELIERWVEKFPE